MEHTNLWAPWRMSYLKGLPQQNEQSCFLCEAWGRPEEDEAYLVVYRAATTMVIMNRYPYTSGHLMVAPAQHQGDLPDMPATLRAEIMETTALAERLIREVLNPQGINIGTNIGRAAGAGLPGHLHMHLVPRWGGDTNFINVIGQVRIIPQALETIYRELKAALPKVLHG